MYIEPNSKIIFLQNCPLDNTYEHTINFNDNDAQFRYFYGLKKHELTQQSYQRVSKGMCRVQLKAEDLYNCNYMMFQNTSFGTKWFYAFITNIDWISPIVTEVTYVIDVMQTWYFDITLLECLIERQHTLSDNIGENIVQEGLELGDLISENNTIFDNFDEWVCVVASTSFTDGSRGSSVHIYNDVWSGCWYLVFTDEEDFNDYINTLLNPAIEASIDDIVCVYMYPKSFTTEIEDNPRVLPQKLVTKTQELYMFKSMFEGYTPKNKKLYTYPYNFLQITDFGGNTVTYRYEFFDSIKYNTSDKITFQVSGEGSPNTEFIATPIGYGGVVGRNYEHACRTSGFPLCSFNTDAFKAWVAQNKTSIETKMFADDVRGFINGAMTGGSIAGSIHPNLAPIGAVTGGIYRANMNYYNNVISALSTSEQMKKTGDYVNGKQGSGLNIALNIQGFCYIKKHITGEYARIIDNFFTMYGYAIKKKDIPNRNARPHFTYVKTNGCNLIGSCPSDGIALIKNIYDKGITFWNDGANVGNYSLDNSPQ